MKEGASVQRVTNRKPELWAMTRMRELVPGKAEHVPANSASVRNLFDTASARADHVPDPLSEIEGAACKDNEFPQVHTAALLVRDMSEVEYAVFRDDIAANGLREPIKVLDGEIIDGRHRMRACRETGTPPRFETVETDDPWGYVRSANIARRHLSVAERAMEAASVATRTREDRKEYNTGKSPDVAAPTQEEAAKTYNVSERSVRKAKRILDSRNGSASRLTQCQRSPSHFMWRCSHEHRARSVVPFVTRAVLSLHEVGLLVVFRLNGAPRIPRDPDRGPSIANAPRGVVYGACARCLQP